MVLAELLEKGGVVMGIILLLSVYVVAVVLYKAYQFWCMEISNTAFLRDVELAVEDRQSSEAIRMAGNQVNPIARVVETALRVLNNQNLSEDGRIREIEASGARELRMFESHLRGLELVANIAPLLGLLGTVIGMVKAFAGIGQVGARVDPSILASGIWEALLTTVAGLMVAIPALAAHYLIDEKVERIRATAKDAVSNILSKSVVA